MVALKNCVLKINYCVCESCEKMLVELGKFPEVQEIDKDAEPNKVTISITGNPYRVTKELEKRNKKFEHFEPNLPTKNRKIQVVSPQKPVPGILDQHVVSLKSSVVKMNYCPCMGCDRILVELKKFHEVQRIDKDAESQNVSILISGDPNRVTKKLKKHNKKFEHFEPSPPINNPKKQILLPPTPISRIQDQHNVPQQPGVQETIGKKTQDFRCPKCKHGLELKKHNKRFSCDGCKEDGFGSRYRCEPCNYDLHEECMSRKPTIFPEFFQGSTFEFRDQPSSRSCYACGKDIGGYFYRCESKHLDLHPCCSKLKVKLHGMDFVHQDKVVSSSPSKCMWCKKKRSFFTKSRDPGGCSYVSACKKFHFHVNCITQMVHEAWKKGAINDNNNNTDGSISMALEKMDLPRTKADSNKKTCERVVEVLKTVSLFLGAIVGIIFGDPYGILVPALFEFFFMLLPKLLPK